jgi:hypothetical protein
VPLKQGADGRACHLAVKVAQVSMKLIVQRWGSGAVRAQQGMGSRRGISSIGGRLPPRIRAMVSGTCPATGSNHGRAYRAPKAKVKLTRRLCDCLVSSPSQDQDRFAAVAKISTTLRIVHVGDAALVECLGSVLGGSRLCLRSHTLRPIGIQRRARHNHLYSHSRQTFARPAQYPSAKTQIAKTIAPSCLI